MNAFGNESNQERLKGVIGRDIVPKLKTLIGPLTDECIEYIFQNSRLKKVTKDQFIDDNESYEDGCLYYLHAGIAHSFYYNPELDKMFSSRIWKKGDVMFDVSSFIHGKDRSESIQMLEDGEVISIAYYNLKAILNKYPQLLTLLLELSIERDEYYKVYHHLLKLRVEERVSLFARRYPTLIGRINKDAIALYLGMSRSRFSTAYAQYLQKEGSA